MFNLGKDKERTIVRDKNSIADKSIPKQVTNDVISVRIVFVERHTFRKLIKETDAPRTKENSTHNANLC